jgi:hypothetical protein
MRSEARDRKIVTNAMRFGVRNPLAIQTAQKMGIRLPGMPRMSGDAMAATGGDQPTTQQIANGLSRAQQNTALYGTIQKGFDPGTAQGVDWEAFINNKGIEKLAPADIRQLQSDLRLARKPVNWKEDSRSKAVFDAFQSGGPKAVDELKKKRAAEADEIRKTTPFLGGGFAF